jgi:hypothetical protein
VPLGELHMRPLRAPVRALGRAEQLFFERVRGRNVEPLVRRAQLRERESDLIDRLREGAE